MRILFDGYWWRAGPPSGRNVLRSLVHTWLEMYPDDVVGMAVPATDVRSVSAELGHRVELHRLRLRPHAFSNILELSRIRGYEALLSQNFAPPRTASRNAVFLHDLIFVEHPEWFTRSERVYLSPIVRLARRADVILTSSNSERERILRSLGSGVPVVAAGLSVPKDLVEVEPMEPLVDLRSGAFLLTVGRLNSRKNLANLVSALAEGGLINADLPLVIVGERDGKLGGTGGPDEWVLFVGGVSNAELKWLYSNCRLAVFPSLDEGFGLPVLEAQLCGAPMAVSDIPPFREMAGPTGAVYFDPRSNASIGSAVRLALDKASAGRNPGALTTSWEKVTAKCRSALASGLE